MQVNSVNETSFKQNIKKEEKIQPKNEAKKPINKKAIGLTLAALGALGVAGVLVVKGKKEKAEMLAKSSLEKLEYEKFKNMAEVSIETFKKTGGKFKSGFATVNDKPFTGIINVAQKNGNKTSMNYLDGKISSSTTIGKKAKIFKKYNYYDTYNDTHIETTIKGKKRITNWVDVASDRIQVGISDFIKEENGRWVKLETKWVDGIPKGLELNKRYERVTKIDPKTKKVIESKIVGKKRLSYSPRAIFKKTENGITYKNGEVFAKREDLGNGHFKITYPGYVKDKIVQVFTDSEGKRKSVVGYIEHEPRIPEVSVEDYYKFIRYQ